MSASVVVPVGSFKLKAHAATVVAHEASIEERVEWLKRQVAELNSRIDLVVNDIDVKTGALKTDIMTEQRAREAADQQMMQRLEENFIGDYGVELLGAGYLIAGVLLSNLGQEFADAAHWLWKIAH